MKYVQNFKKELDALTKLKILFADGITFAPTMDSKDRELIPV